MADWMGEVGIEDGSLPDDCLCFVYIQYVGVDGDAVILTLLSPNSHPTTA